MIRATGIGNNTTVKAAIESVSNIVKETYGPNGGFVVVTDGTLSFPTKDGVTVLMSISSDNVFENAILNIIKSSAKNTMSKAGDGTTTTVILAYEIFKRFNSKDFMSKDSIIEDAKENIRKMSRPVSEDDFDILQKVALTSSAGDKELSDAIVNAVLKARKNGANSIFAEVSMFDKTSVSEINGISFSCGIPSRTFYEGMDKLTRELGKTAVTVSVDEVFGEDEIVSFITSCVERGIKNAVIIAPKFADNAISAMAINDKSSINIVPIVVFDENSSQGSLAIEAIAAALDIEEIGEKAGTLLDDIDFDRNIAMVDSVKVNNLTVTIVDNKDVPKKAKQLIESYEYSLRRAQSDSDRDVFKILMSILNKKIIKVVIHADSAHSARERKDRADDCINSVELALDTGVVRGGGRAYLEIDADVKYKTEFRAAAAEVVNLIGDSSDAFDPTYVVETVAEQAIDLAFTLGKTNGIVLKGDM